MSDSRVRLRPFGTGQSSRGTGGGFGDWGNFFGGKGWEESKTTLQAVAILSFALLMLTSGKRIIFALLNGFFFLLRGGKPVAQPVERQDDEPTASDSVLSKLGSSFSFLFFPRAHPPPLSNQPSLTF